MLAEDLSPLIPFLRGEQKYFNVCMDEIARQFYEDRHLDTSSEHKCRPSADGEEIEVPLRLVVSGVEAYPEAWEIALLAADHRFDGIGYHEWSVDPEGVEFRGWHRHCWDRRRRNVDCRRPITIFDGIEPLTPERFVRLSLAELGVVLDRRDDGNAEFVY